MAAAQLGHSTVILTWSPMPVLRSPRFEAHLQRRSSEQINGDRTGLVPVSKYLWLIAWGAEVAIYAHVKEGLDIGHDCWQAMYVHIKEHTKE